MWQYFDFVLKQMLCKIRNCEQTHFSWKKIIIIWLLCNISNQDSLEKSASSSHAMAMPAVAEESSDFQEIPTKIVSTKVNLNLRAQIQYLDFEGECLKQVKINTFF